MRITVKTLVKTCKTIATFTIASLIGLSVAACGSQTPDTSTKPTEDKNKPISVVSTVDTWGSLAKEIGGTDVKVVSLLAGADTDISDVKLNGKTSEALSSAQVIVTNGAGYDDWATKNLPKQAENVSAASTVGALKGDNPYLWMSKDARKAMANSLSEAFSRVKPNKRKEFEQRLNDWKDREKKLEDYLDEFAKKHKDLKIASTSPILFWLMSDLNLKDNAPKDYLSAISQETDPSSKSVSDFSKMLEDRKVDVLINDSQQSKNDNINLITGIAGRSYTSIINVSELMPSYAKQLDTWIIKICDDIDNATKMSSSMREEIDKQLKKPSKLVTEKPKPVVPGPARSNQGQTDPGK